MVAQNPDILFSAKLTPYRSLGRRGFRILMVLLGVYCFGAGIVFAALGVWPVAGFLGADLMLIYWAFKASFRDGRMREDVEISRSHVLLRKISPRGDVRHFRFPQFGTRFVVNRHDEIGITDMFLVSRRRRVPFGHLLNPADRESFAAAFGQALAQAKN